MEHRDLLPGKECNSGDLDLYENGEVLCNRDARFDCNVVPRELV